MAASTPASTPPPPLRDIERRAGWWEERLLRRRIAVGTRPDGWPVLVRPDSVLAKAVDDEAVERLVPEAEHVGLSVDASTARDVRRIGDYVRLDVTPDQVGAPASRWSVAPVARSMARLGERGFKAKPNHVYLASGHVHGHTGFAIPAGDVMRRRTTARPARPLTFPEPLRLLGHRSPRVLVLDTGLRVVRAAGVRVAEHIALRDAVELHPAWRSSPGVCAIDDDDEPHADHDRCIDTCAGHGTFIAGIVRRLCPDAVIHVDGVLSSFGDGDDDSIEAGIRRAVERIRPLEFDVVVMSLRAHTTDDRFPPLASVVQHIARNGRTLVVAAAGNDASARPAFPAAIPEVVSVGALDAGGRAWFSNFGGWVDACAPGVDVVSTFFCDAADVDGDTTRRFSGWAAWSGTSFAAPKVAATVAQEMYLHGGSALEAWRRLSSCQRVRHPDLGVVFDVT